MPKHEGKVTEKLLMTQKIQETRTKPARGLMLFYSSYLLIYHQSRFEFLWQLQEITNLCNYDYKGVMYSGVYHL